MASFLVVHNNPVPNFDKEVIEPLQAEQAQQAAAEAAQAAADALATQQAAEAAYVAPAPAVSVGGDYKILIYMAESGNDPTRWNSSGCVGLGQACPASKLLAVCPNLDYACEDNWFTQYMLAVYGSWANAWAVRESRNPTWW